VATFFSVTAYNPLIVVAVLKAMAVAPPSIARATPRIPPPQPRQFLLRTTGASKPTNSPTPAARFVAINHPAKTQPEVTAIRHVRFAPLQDVSAAPLEKESSSVLEESMNDPVVAQLRNERSQEVQRGMRSVMVGVLIEREAKYDDAPGSESVKPLGSVAIGTHQDANPSMSFIQLEALSLTPSGGIFDLWFSVRLIVLRMTSILTHVLGSSLGRMESFLHFTESHLGFLRIIVFGFGAGGC
jgi:hypothetical protein